MIHFRKVVVVPAAPASCSSLAMRMAVAVRPQLGKHANEQTVFF